jgi:hypothetical protein
MSCPICTDREDLARQPYLKYGKSLTSHDLLDHTGFAQEAWELGIYREDNPDEWRELKRLTREVKR